MIPEEFLHYVWRFRLLQGALFCVSGEPLLVVHPGEYNRDGGPDFINARVQIGSTLWAGNVEMHLQASDWYRHGHQEDPAYNNVILHVVDCFDGEVIGSGNQPIPALEARPHYPAALTTTYKKFQSAKQWIPCQNQIREVDQSVFRLWAPALALERINSRAEIIRTWLGHSENQWDELVYQVMAGALGNRINAQPFELLARATPLKILLRYRDRIHLLEAMLFGQAGLLDPSYPETYPKELLKDYLFFADKYSLMPLERGTWKFLRLRPINFPTIRISQLATLIHRREGFREMLVANLVKEEWVDMFRVTASRYWDTHYTFNRVSAAKVKRVGIDAIHLVLINGIAPLLYLYGKEKKLVPFTERTLTLLEEIPGEENSIVSSWSQLGLPTQHALFTQALKQLKTTYCDRKRCLDCRIGARILGCRI